MLQAMGRSTQIDVYITIRNGRGFHGRFLTMLQAMKRSTQIDVSSE